eukprot:jgi/Tetstr1/427987/TSEL_018060.t1
MDSSKTLLPHSPTWSKDVVKDKLLKAHLTSVKCNGMCPDEMPTFMSQWPDTDVHGPEEFVKYVPEGKPSYLHGLPVFHSHKDGRVKTVPLSEPEAGPAGHNAHNAAELPNNAEVTVGRMIEVMDGLMRLE